jgi:3-oxoadipate enol-lactonase
MALAEPSRVESHVLLAPGISGCDYPFDPDLDARCEELAAAGDLTGVARLQLTIWGRAGDNPVVLDSNRLAAGRIPGCELIVVPGVDHYPTYRVPGLIAETIIRHCSR